MSASGGALAVVLFSVLLLQNLDLLQNAAGASGSYHAVCVKSGSCVKLKCDVGRDTTMQSCTAVFIP